MEYHEHPSGSLVVQTAWALIALMEADYPHMEPLRKGIQLLMDRQQENGEWLQEAIEGVFNIRDFGAGYPTSQGNARVKPLFLFRSGEPSRITSKGIEQLKTYGIRIVFDLRADVEIKKYNTATPEIEGVEFVRSSILEEALDPVGIAEQYAHPISS